jgi:SAM-dependent methyltransferase
MTHDRFDLGSVLRGAALRARLLGAPARQRDLWLDEALGLEGWVEDVDLPLGGVPYLPCPVDLILAAVSHCALGSDDVFVDLGAGLGRVAMLAHLLTGATAVGIEAQQHLVDRGRRRCHALGLERVRLLHADAATVALEGTVFFLYSPFNGPTLRRVVNNLEALARRHPLTICAVDLDLPDLKGLVRVPCPEVELALWRTPD